MASEHDESRKRWTAKRRVALIVEILRGETSVVEAARKHGLTVAELEDWRERFLTGAEHALHSRPTDEDGQKEREIKRWDSFTPSALKETDFLGETMPAIYDSTALNLFRSL